MTTETTNPSKPIQTACGGDIENPQDYPSAFYRGKRIYFCNRNCKKAFLSDPEGFMADEIDHETGEAITD